MKGKELSQEINRIERYWLGVSSKLVAFYYVTPPMLYHQSQTKKIKSVIQAQQITLAVDPGRPRF